MNRHLRDAGFGVTTTFPNGELYDTTFAGDFCIISAQSPVQLAFAANQLAIEGGYELHGSPAHDGNHFHQWMVRQKRKR